MNEIEELNRDFTRQYESAERSSPIQTEITDNQRLTTLVGVRNHTYTLYDQLGTKKAELTAVNYRAHLQTVIIAAGNGLLRARSLGVFDEFVDLLNILDGVERGEYHWQTGNLAHDRFHGFWYWIKAKDDPGFDERGPYQPYALKRLLEILDDAIRGTK